VGSRPAAGPPPPDAAEPRWPGRSRPGPPRIAPPGAGRQHRGVPARSAGLLLYRTTTAHPEVLLAHPGGPFWARKDAGVWSVPKGEYEEGADALAAARREFAEETGLRIPPGEPWPLGEVTQRSGKRVTAWALEGDLDLTGAFSNTFEMEWPRGSGRLAEFPEVDRIEWFTLDQALLKIIPAQIPFLERLEAALAESGPGPATAGSPP
jgi:predicted NUDIX family NTP pyrophosphohydrolase